MRIFLTTDTHFYHDQMVKYCGRPINHTEIIGNGFLKFGFTKDDILIHLGDICIGHDTEAHRLYIQPLECHKWLLRGNHDHQSMTWYLNHGWDWVGDEMKTVMLGRKIVFSHIPVAWDGLYEFNIHGHFHNDTHRSFEPELLAIKNDRQKLLSIEGGNFAPILLERFLANAENDVGGTPR